MGGGGTPRLPPFPQGFRPDRHRLHRPRLHRRALAPEEAGPDFVPSSVTRRRAAGCDRVPAWTSPDGAARLKAATSFGAWCAHRRGREEFELQPRFAEHVGGHEGG
jgi:hypothetical protein